MEQLLLWGLGLWVLTRMGKKGEAPAAAKGGAGGLVRAAIPNSTTKDIVAGKFVCRDPQGPARVAKLAKIDQQLQLKKTQAAQASGERKRDLQRDITELTDERDIVADDHVRKCLAFEEYLKTVGVTPKQTFSPETKAQQAPQGRTVG